MPERRSSERKKVLLEARWSSISRRHEARVDDVSLGGCFVNTYGHAELNEPIDLEILMPSGDWLALQGVVATYHAGVGFGMSFTALSEQQTASLKELLDTAAEHAA
jgi:hypothetical protein